MKNNNSNNNVTKSPTIMGFGFFSILLIFLIMAIGGIIIFERDVPEENRSNMLGYIGGLFVTLACIYIIYKFSGRNFEIMGKQIDSGMIIYILIILLLIFLND